MPIHKVELKTPKSRRDGKSEIVYSYIDEEDLGLFYSYRYGIRNKYGVKYARRWCIDMPHTRYLSRDIMEARLGRKLRKDEVIDHIDHNTLNNCRSNLRVCSWRENWINSAPRYNQSSIYKGLTQTEWRKDGTRSWQVRVRSLGVYTYVKQVRNEIEGALLYDRAARKTFGEFAFLNFPALIHLPMDEALRLAQV